MGSTQRRAIILGGGMAGLTTAWRITQGNWREHFESVHLYQMGWRLGGKCATGRGPHCRIEEHGIHLFGGGYWNALPMMQSVYAELADSPEAGAAGFAQAFEKQFTSVRVSRLPLPVTKAVTQLPHSALTMDQARQADGQRHVWLAAALRNMAVLLQVGQGLERTPGVLQVLQPVFRLAGVAAHAAVPGPAAAAGVLMQLAADIDAGTVRTAADASPALAALRVQAATAFPGQAGERLPVVVGRLLAVLGSQLPPLPDLRMAALGLLGWAMALNFIAGFAESWLSLLEAHPPTTVSALDAQRHDAFLTGAAGLWQATVDSDLVQATIRILYQFRDGDFSQPDIGAGALLHFLLRTWAYAEVPYWFFAEGTGETVIRPLYELLVKRGVQFHFFHQVRALRLDATHKRLAAIDFQIQARTVDGAPYQPLDHRRCWPARPLAGQLANGDAIAALADDALESAWHPPVGEPWRLDLDPVHDSVVLAIPVGAVPSLCSELTAASPQWAAMANGIGTVQTQSLQVWLDSSSAALGVNVKASQDIPDDDTGLGAGLSGPYETFSDFSLILTKGHECWPAPAPQALWYLSDVQPTPPGPAPLGDADHPQACRDAALASAERFLRSELPRVLQGVGTKGPVSLGNLVMHSPFPEASDAERLRQQYIRSNFEPSERYVQALHGTTHLRLPAGASDTFAGLYLAGDWTRNGLNVGCVEATVMSGLQCGNALLGRQRTQGVVGVFD